MALADEILIRLEVNSAKAERNLQNVSKTLDRVAAEATDAIRPMDVLETQLDKVGMAAYNAKLKLTDFNNPLGKIPPIAGGAVPPLSSTNKVLAKLGRNAGMAGIQVQQFVGQIQGGVNPMVALSQQGADLGFVLGVPLLGAIVGIGASLAGMLVPALLGSSDSIAEAAKVVRKLKEEFDELSASQKQLLFQDQKRQIEETRENILGLNARINGLNEAQKEQIVLNSGVVVSTGRVIEKTQAEKDQLLLLNVERDGQVKLLGKLELEYAQLLGLIPRVTDEEQKAAELLKNYIESIKDQIATFGMARSEILRYQASKKDLNNEEQFQVDLLAELYEQQENQRDATKKQRKETAEAIKAQKAKVDSLMAEVRADERWSRARQARIDAEKREADLLERQAQAIKESLNPWLRYNRILEEYQKLLKAGELTVSEFALAENELEIATVQAAAKLKDQSKDLDELEKKFKVTKIAMEDVAVRGIGSLEDALVDMSMGTKTAKEAFSSMARSIINDLIRMQIRASIVQPLSGAISGFFAPSGGAGVDAQGAAAASASYGLGGGFTGVGSGNSSTMKKMSFIGGGYTGVGARSGGMDNKGGFPAILHPNETVIDHNQGQSVGGNVTINLNVSTGVSATVRAEMMTMLPMITNSTKAAILDARRRGGAFAQTFGG